MADGFGYSYLSFEAVAGEVKILLSEDYYYVLKIEAVALGVVKRD